MKPLFQLPGLAQINMDLKGFAWKAALAVQQSPPAELFKSGVFAEKQVRQNEYN